MNRVFIISPYRGDLVNNIAYAHAAVADCLRRGESPYASHLMLTEALNDDNPHERYLGMQAGREWMKECHHAAVYDDFGVTEGMLDDIEGAGALNLRIERRSVAFKTIKEKTQKLLVDCEAYFGVPPGAIRRSGKGNAQVTLARDAFSYVARQHRLHTNEIASLLGLSGASGVYTCLRRAEWRVEKDAFFRNAVVDLRE